MANFIVKKGSTDLASAFNRLEKGFDNTAAPTAGGDPFLKMSKAGVWNYGVDDVRVEKGSKWAINPLAMGHGWVCWNADERSPDRKLGEVMVSAFDPLPEQHTLANHGASEWKHQYSLMLVCISGKDAGVQVAYNISSFGGNKAIQRELQPAIEAQIAKESRKPMAQRLVVPIVTLESAPYKSKSYGEIFNPVFNIVSWTTLDAEPEPAAAANDDDGEVPFETEDAPVEEAPRRRTRSRT